MKKLPLLILSIVVLILSFAPFSDAVAAQCNPPLAGDSLYAQKDGISPVSLVTEDDLKDGNYRLGAMCEPGDLNTIRLKNRPDKPLYWYVVPSVSVLQVQAGQESLSNPQDTSSSALLPDTASVPAEAAKTASSGKFENFPIGAIIAIVVWTIVCLPIVVFAAKYQTEVPHPSKVVIKTKDGYDVFIEYTFVLERLFTAGLVGIFRSTLQESAAAALVSGQINALLIKYLAGYDLNDVGTQVPKFFASLNRRLDKLIKLNPDKYGWGLTENGVQHAQTDYSEAAEMYLASKGLGTAGATTARAAFGIPDDASPSPIQVFAAALLQAASNLRAPDKSETGVTPASPTGQKTEE